MSRGRLADAFDQLAEAAASVALELRASEQPAAGSAPSPAPAPTQAAAAPPPAAAASLPPRRQPQDESAFTECPAHRKAWVEGRYGKYCPAHSDDPDWSNDKGYCRVTPRSAAAWLRKHTPQVTA